MDYQRFLPGITQFALNNDPPGAWMPSLPAGCIPLHSGYPATELIPHAQLRMAACRLIEEERDLPFHYIGSPRTSMLQSHIENRLRRRGVRVQDGELLITAGACQAIDLIARVVLDETSVVAVESPTYMEALEIFRNYTKQIIEIPLDQDGLCTDVLEERLRERAKLGLPQPRLLYTIPSFQNPSGTCLNPERRKRLLELSDIYDFLILEDDAYGELAFGEIPTPIKAGDGGGRVLQVGSLSKVVAPGLRVGWLVGPAQLVAAASWFKKDLDHPFSQAVMATYLETLDFDERIQTLREAYHERRDVMMEALERTLPREVRWQVPTGGYFVWLNVPGVDTRDLLRPALEAGVSYVPGAYFFGSQEDGANFLRLSYSYVEPQMMVKGLERLAQVLGGADRS